MNNLNKNKTFETNNFPLAISILCLGLKIVELNRQDPRRVIFIFQKTKELDKAINDFYNDKLLVNPQEFFNKQKLLKSRIYE